NAIPFFCYGLVLNLGTPQTTAGCSPIVSVTNDHSSSIYPVGTTVVTWTVTDASGNTATCQQNVTVVDTQDPFFIVPGNRTVNANAGQCYATNVNLGTPTLQWDNCGIASVTNNAPAQFPVGTTVVTWTITDVHGNTRTGTQNVTVNDNQNPVISCPAAITVNTDAGQCYATIANLGTPVTSDNCGVQSVTNNHPSSVYPVGTTTVTWTVTDVHGRTRTCTQQVTVADMQAPVPNVLNLPVISGTCSVTVSTIPTATDNCQGQINGTTSDPTTYTVPGNYTITWTYTDSHGNSSTQTQQVIVTGSPAPTGNATQTFCSTTTSQVTTQCVPLTTLVDMVESPFCSWTDPSGEYYSYGASSVNVAAGVATHLEASYNGTAANEISIIGMKATGTTGDYKTFNIWTYVDPATKHLYSGIGNYSELRVGTTALQAGDLYGIFVSNTGVITIQYYRSGSWHLESTFTATYPSASAKYFVVQKMGPGKVVSNLKAEFASVSVSSAPTVADLVATGSNIQWYATASGGSPLPATTVLVNGQHYYASQTINGCESSTRLDVLVSVSIVSAPTVGVITQPTCVIPTGSVALSGLPAGSWTLTRNPGGVTTNGSGNSTIVNNLQAGVTYTFTVTSGSCTSGSSANVVINSAPTTPTVSSITGPTSVCVGSSIQLSNATPGGTWISSNPSRASVSNTGLVTANSATGGGVTITYRITNSCGTVSTSRFITIQSQPFAFIYYFPGFYCKTAGSVNVTRIGQSGGTYSSTAGLSINASTGRINLGASSTGTYTVTYTYGNGSCTRTATATVSIFTCGNKTASEEAETPSQKTQNVDPKRPVIEATSLEATAYPNPTQNYFNLKVRSNKSDNVQIKVFDMAGKLLTVLNGSVGETYRFGERYTSGAYVVEVKQGEQRVTTRVIKQ
ncbi:MAG: HYR domain-containing protein, partial [Bacteroidetes bacterium]|nr:HYR domain-containing protein [Bacteroidota bacterium]